MLGFLKAPFLVPHFSCYTQFNFRSQPPATFLFSSHQQAVKHQSLVFFNDFMGHIPLWWYSLISTSMRAMSSCHLDYNIARETNHGWRYIKYSQTAWHNAQFISITQGFECACMSVKLQYNAKTIIGVLLQVLRLLLQVAFFDEPTVL